MNTPIYLDYAAATPVEPAVFTAMQPYFSDMFFNPSATYLAAQQVKKDLEAARAHVAQQLGSKPLEVTFTAGGSEANNLAIRGVMESFPGKHVLVSAIEHDSVLAPARLYDHSLVPVNTQGQIDVAQLAELIRDDTVLISVMIANNEIGVLQQISKITKMVEAVRKARKEVGNITPLYVHTDACQAALYLDIHVSRLGVDMLTLNGGKMYGPKQSGVLYVKSGVQLAPQIVGGGQERGRRSGTENVAFAVGFAVALQHAQAHREVESKRLCSLQHEFITAIQKALPTVQINGSLKHRLPNNVHITIPGIDNERVLFELDERSIMAAAGSACSASSDEPSHVLRALGVSDASAQSSLRFSFGHQTTSEQLQTVIAALKLLANREA